MKNNNRYFIAVLQVPVLRALSGSLGRVSKVQILEIWSQTRFGMSLNISGP